MKERIENTQPTKKVELHPAPIVDALSVPPRFTKISRHLGDSIRGSDSQQHLMKLRSSLAKRKKNTTSAASQPSRPVSEIQPIVHTRLLHFVVKSLERRIPEPRSLVVDRRRLLRQRLNAIQHLEQRRDSLTIAQHLTGEQPAW
jgi:hypothetical protein